MPFHNRPVILSCVAMQSFPDIELRVLIVADNILARAGLAALLEERGCTVVAQSDGNDLDAAVAVGQADALVIDLGWQGDALRSKLAELDRDLPVLALVTDDETDESLRDLLASLAILPGYGIVPRDSDPDAIASALYALDHGLVVLDPRLTRLRGISAPAPGASSGVSLTPRENEVLQLLAQGMTNKGIALDLGITQHTVKFHVNAIMSKLGAQSRTEAVVRATQLGMIVL